MKTTIDSHRICGTCGKRFYIGFTIDRYIFQILRTKNKSPTYFCKYSCYKKETDLRVDKRLKKNKETS